jgi:hypothetical protein
MQFGRVDYEHIQDTTIAKDLSLRALQTFKDLPSVSILNRLAREVLHLKSDDPVPEKFEYFPDTDTHLIPLEEPVFMLRAQDALAERALEHWIILAMNKGVDAYTIQTAQLQLLKFKAWYKKKKPNVRVVRS